MKLILYTVCIKSSQTEFNNDVTSTDHLTCMISSDVFVKLEELTTGKEVEGPEQ
jgi:hypothetical protein